ncbi:MAG: hypothetical protein ACRYGG_07775 [Janthinobacterium lividum]
MAIGHTLPKVPSQLIRLGLENLRKVEANSRYSVDMECYYCAAILGAPCRVGFDGATIAMSLGQPIDVFCGPSQFERSKAMALKALDYFRSGRVAEACNFLGTQAPFKSADIPNYARDRDGFHVAMLALAVDLAEAGY